MEYESYTIWDVTTTPFQSSGTGTPRVLDDLLRLPVYRCRVLRRYPPTTSPTPTSSPRLFGKFCIYHKHLVPGTQKSLDFDY